MKPIALDEYPIHQAAVSMARVATSDRNFYDRYYFNAHDRTGDVFLVAGMGIYPNLGVMDAMVTVRTGDRQRAVRFSDAIAERSMDTTVGGFRLEIIKPLQSLRLICEHPDLQAELTWEGSFPAVLEEPHLLMNGLRPSLDATRFAQVGTWSGTLSVDGADFAVDSETWVGTRDRSWGIRPIGEKEPDGRAEEESVGGFWWTYVPLRFDDYAMMLIMQEGPDGHRSLNHATRVFADGRVEQLGWPRVEVTYASGTRTPVSARIHLTTPQGEPIILDIEMLGHIALTIGAGYSRRGDDWSHGQWKGRDWSESMLYTLSDPGLVAQLPAATTDHVARATCDGNDGWGMFEHAVRGLHLPSGFDNNERVAP